MDIYGQQMNSWAWSVDELMFTESKCDNVGHSDVVFQTLL